MSIINILVYSIDVFVKDVMRGPPPREEIKYQEMGAGLSYSAAYAGRPRGYFLGC